MPVNWSCWPSSHLCKSDGLQNPHHPGHLSSGFLGPANKVNRVSMISEAPDQALPRILSHRPCTACVAMYSTAPHSRVSGCAIGVGHSPHPHQGLFGLLFQLPLSALPANSPSPPWPRSLSFSGDPVLFRSHCSVSVCVWCPASLSVTPRCWLLKCTTLVESMFWSPPSM